MCESFEKAVEGQSASPCPIIDFFEQKKWNFMDLNKIESEMGQNVKAINLPYDKDYAAMP